MALAHNNSVTKKPFHNIKNVLKKSSQLDVDFPH